VAERPWGFESPLAHDMFFGGSYRA
jgi:hypothetical protein